MWLRGGRVKIQNTPDDAVVVESDFSGVGVSDFPPCHLPCHLSHLLPPRRGAPAPTFQNEKQSMTCSTRASRDRAGADLGQVLPRRRGPA